MTGKKKSHWAQFHQLEDEIAEDILGASDADILAEFAEEGGDARQFADAMRANFETSLLAANKARMAAAKAGAAAARQSRAGSAGAPIDVDRARSWLRGLSNRPDIPDGLTLGARNESELSDVNGGAKVGHVAAQNQASGAAPSAMARALVI